MESKPSNPLAFPMQTDMVVNYGMTLRDYFAAKVMQGFTSNTLIMQTISDEFYDGNKYLVKQSYQISDEMLKQREL